MLCFCNYSSLGTSEYKKVHRVIHDGLFVCGMQLISFLV